MSTVRASSLLKLPHHGPLIEDKEGAVSHWQTFALSHAHHTTQTLPLTSYIIWSPELANLIIAAAHQQRQTPH